jgi:hypothetical protein
LQDSFATDHFSERGITIEQHALARLDQIAHHPFFSKKVKHIVLSTYSGAPVRRHLENESDRMVDLSRHVEQSVLIASGIAGDLLSKCFERLPNLMRVSLQDFPFRRCNSTLVEPSNSFLTDADTQQRVDTLVDHPGHLALLLSALGRGAKYPAELKVESQQFGLPLSALNLPQVTSPGLSKTTFGVLEQLESLELELYLPHRPFTSVGDTRRTHEESLPESALRRFLHTTKSLRSLRLHFNMDLDNFPDRFTEWLSHPPSMTPTPTNALQTSTPPAPLEHLRSLELGECALTSEHIVQVLVRFSTLRSVGLSGITLKPSRTEDAGRNQWTPFFRSLASRLPATSNIGTAIIERPSQICGAEQRVDVVDMYFRDPIREANASDEMDYYTYSEFHAGQGIGLHEWLRRQSTRMVQAS